MLIAHTKGITSQPPGCRGAPSKMSILAVYCHHSC